eukprot:3793258-Pleurochrysis_carterae.AAC.1
MHSARHSQVGGKSRQSSFSEVHAYKVESVEQLWTVASRTADEIRAKQEQKESKIRSRSSGNQIEIGWKIRWSERFFTQIDYHRSGRTLDPTCGLNACLIYASSAWRASAGVLARATQRRHSHRRRDVEKQQQAGRESTKDLQDKI